MEVWLLLAHFVFVAVEFDMTAGVYATEKLCLEAMKEKQWFTDIQDKKYVGGRRLTCVSVKVIGSVSS